MNHQVGVSSPAKLTSWANEPTLQALKQDLQASQSSQQMQVTKIKGWNDILNARGKHAGPKVKGRSSVQPKLARRQAEWRYSALTEPFLSTKRPFKVSPRTFEDGKAARQNEQVLTYQFQHKLNRVKLIDDFVRSAVDDGTVILQLGWCRKLAKTKQEVPVWTYLAPQSQEEIEQLKQAIDLKTSDPRSFDEQVSPELQAAVSYYEETGQPNVAQQTGTEMVQVEVVMENHPTVRVLEIANVTIDPSSEGDLNKARFVMVSFETSQAELKAEGNRYQNLDQVIWENSGPINTPNHETQTPGDFQFSDAARRRVVAIEYWGFWDIAGNGVLEPIVATWIGDTLIRMEKNPFPDGKLPFVLAPYTPVKRELYGEPDAHLLEDNQKILGALMRGMIDLLGRSANSQQGFAKGMLDPLNRRRFENGQDYEFNPNLSPTVGHITHQYPELPQSALLMLNLQNQEAEALTGVKSFAGGLSGESYGDVAAGIRGALDAASKREMAILRRLAQAMREVANKIIAMNAVWLSAKETIRITNEEFVEIKREDLTASAGGFDLEVDISTAEVDNAQAQDLAFMLQTLGNTVDVKITLMILAEICRLKRMPELEHALKTYQPQPSPFEQEMQQLQLEEARAKVAKLRSEEALNKARAEREAIEADKTEIDTTEQVTGIKHARNKDLAEGQAQGNKELQVTKALTTPRKADQGEPDIEAAIGYNQLTDGTHQMM